MFAVRLICYDGDGGLGFTMIRINRHDLDHGSEKDVAKKLTRNAGVFEKYSGKKAPEECGPDEFLGVQLRVLRELTKFLNALKK